VSVRMTMIPTILRISLLFAVSASAQKVPAKTSAPKPSQETVYSNTWDTAEIKTCTTYSDHSHLLICDGDKMGWSESFLNLLGNNAGKGMSNEEAYHQAFAFALTHGKTFLVKFTKNPWPNPARAGSKMAAWDCAKDTKMITCSLDGQEK